MPEKNENSTPADALWKPLVDEWTNCMRQAHATTRQTLRQCEGSQGSSTPQAWRQQWFDALGRWTDIYLRSPPFLQMMKTQVDALIRARQEHRDSSGTGGSHSGLPGADEFNELLEQLDETEETLRPQLEQLKRRVDSARRNHKPPRDVDGWDHFLSVFRMKGTTPPTRMGVTPHDVVYQAGSLKLLQYRSDPARYSEPVLICFALINRPHVLDLQDDRSVVRALLERGLDVYLIDWGTPTDADQKLRLHDYVCRFMKNVTDVVRQRSACPQLNVLGYCMGGTMSTMFTALHPERVRNLVLMATPIDFAGDEGLLNLWLREEYFDVDRLIDAYGNCPGEFLQYCFQLMKPVQNFAEKYLTFCERLDDSAFLDNFLAMERWAGESIPVAGETFREYVKLLYQQNRLVQGKMSLADKPVRLDAITCPLLLLVADRDHLVPPSSTLALERHVRSDEVKSMSIDTGHIGLAVSTKAHRQLWPQAANWIADHSTPRL